MPAPSRRARRPSPTPRQPVERRGRSQGVVNSVSTWLTIRPPTIVMPSGWRSSEPTPPAEHQRQRAKQRGHGGHQDRPEAQQAGLAKIASRGDLPSLRSASSAKSIIMIAFFLTMPIKQDDADDAR